MHGPARAALFAQSGPNYVPSENGAETTRTGHKLAFREGVLLVKIPFRVPRQHLTKWSKNQYLCGIAATGAGLLSTFYQH